MLIAKVTTRNAKTRTTAIITKSQKQNAAMNNRKNKMIMSQE